MDSSVSAVKTHIPAGLPLASGNSSSKRANKCHPSRRPSRLGGMKYSCVRSEVGKATDTALPCSGRPPCGKRVDITLFAVTTDRRKSIDWRVEQRSRVDHSVLRLCYDPSPKGRHFANQQQIREISQKIQKTRGLAAGQRSDMANKHKTT